MGARTAATGKHKPKVQFRSDMVLDRSHFVWLGIFGAQNESRLPPRSFNEAKKLSALPPQSIKEALFLSATPEHL